MHVKGKSHNGRDVVRCGMSGVVSSNVGMVKRVACDKRIDGEGVSRLLLLSMLDEAVSRIDKAVLWD